MIRSAVFRVCAPVYKGMLGLFSELYLLRWGKREMGLEKSDICRENEKGWGGCIIADCLLLHHAGSFDFLFTWTV